MVIFLKYLHIPVNVKKANAQLMPLRLQAIIEQLKKCSKGADDSLEEKKVLEKYYILVLR